MRRALAERRRCFNHLQMVTMGRLTSKNKQGTLLRPSSAAVRPAQAHKTGRTDMLAPLFSLFFLGCFWVAGSLALQQLYDSRGDILAALSGRGGLKRLPRRAGA